MPFLSMKILLLTIAAMVSAQKTTIDQSILDGIFGTPSTTPSTPTSTGFEDIVVKPTDASTNFVDANGDACKCVPYYLCDTNLIGVFADNSSVTGFGELDIRFREDDCQESTERCCKNPKKEEEVPIPIPDPSSLRGCGYRNPNGLDFTITGGTGREAQFGEFPWVVAVLNSDMTNIGVGVLIHPQVVLTGAHIVYNYQPNQLVIRAGEWDTQTVKERLKHQERTVKELHIHSGFHGEKKNLINDMALMFLKEPVQLSSHINVICLPGQDEDFSRYKGCVANGWGTDYFGKQGRYAVILKKVEVDMVARDRCTTLLQRTRLGNKFRLHKSFVCAGGEEGKDTCRGDGGAPLACPIGDDRYKLTGLVAWGIGCGEKDVPAVYAAVSVFRGWIDQQMGVWDLDTSGYNI